MKQISLATNRYELFTKRTHVFLDEMSWLCPAAVAGRIDPACCADGH
jgi:hypothetical protein